MTLRIVVLGASGALGSHVVRQARQEGHTVTAVVRNPSRLRPDLSPTLKVRQVDLGKVRPVDLSEALRGHDVLINAAGFVADGPAAIRLAYAGNDCAVCRRSGTHAGEPEAGPDHGSQAGGIGIARRHARIKKTMGNAQVIGV